jgi:CubicO group peptidase (beta-lactamase class C family)
MDTATTITTLEQHIPGWMESSAVVGLSVVLIADARVVWSRGFGYKDKAAEQLVTPATIFQAASLSKPVFAYIVLKLAAAGVLDLDAPLSDYMPEPYIADEPRLPLITARRVLCHTPGFPNWRSEDKPLGIYFTPGERFSYSGEGYVYLQKVVEHVTGESLTELAQTHIFQPFDMPSSSYVWIEPYDTLAAQGYKVTGEPAEVGKMDTPNAAYSLYTTPSEFARFVCAIMEPRESPAYLSIAQTAEMLHPHVSVNDNPDWGDNWPATDFQMNHEVSWGLGWGLEHIPGGDIFWHWGDNGAFRAFVMGSQTQKTGLVMMSNSANGLKLCTKLYGATMPGPHPGITWLES